jgi:hypothetical protein
MEVEESFRIRRKILFSKAPINLKGALRRSDKESEKRHEAELDAITSTKKWLFLRMMRNSERSA